MDRKPKKMKTRQKVFFNNVSEYIMSYDMHAYVYKYYNYHKIKKKK